MTYLQSPLPNFIASLQKDDSLRITDRVLSFIPMPDMSQAWTEQQLMQEFGFTEAEMGHLQHRVAGIQQSVTDVDSTGGNSNSSSLLESFVQQQGSAFMMGQWNWLEPAAAPAAAARGESGRRSGGTKRSGSKNEGQKATKKPRGAARFILQ